MLSMNRVVSWSGTSEVVGYCEQSHLENIITQTLLTTYKRLIIQQLRAVTEMKSTL